MHIIIYYFSLAPLLQFNDNDIIFTLFVRSNYDKVNTFRCLGNVILDGNLNIIINLGIINDIAHKLHGIVPRSEFAILPGIQSSLPNEIQNLCRNDTRLDILDKKPFVRIIDNHTAYSSLYFFALPLAFSTGYFAAFLAIFSLTIVGMSKSYLPANKIA